MRLVISTDAAFWKTASANAVRTQNIAMSHDNTAEEFDYHHQLFNN